MKFYDVAISLGQFCMTSITLRQLNLQGMSMVFDWSSGTLVDKCGQGGLEGKVDLICNDFKDFFNIEDFENRGPNTEKCETLWVVNKRTGLQYRHDFYSHLSIEEQFDKVKEKYTRRVKRLYSTISASNRILFVFINKNAQLTNEIVIEQQEKLSKKFPNKVIDFLYIYNDYKFNGNKYKEFNLTPNIHCIGCNFMLKSYCEVDEPWNENTEAYYPLIKRYCITPATFLAYKNKIANFFKQIKKLHTTACFLLKHRNIFN